MTFMNKNPHLVKCLNCDWWDIAKNLADADALGEAHNLRHHPNKMRWETADITTLSFQPEFYRRKAAEIKKSTHQQRHALFQLYKPYIALIFAPVTVPQPA